MEKNDVLVYIAMGRKLHEVLASRAENAHLTRAIMGLRWEMRLYGIDSPVGRDRPPARAE
ncbi:hypothetical protein [Thiocapsa sp.]|uniref:hypothetical protein n=1 Tax=Thiocapsa sp. TaxID=2024551 RepID=UPI0035935929